MGANGNRKQTLRSNIVQPYESGLLADAGHKDYNAVLGQELDKVSTATKHMFQGLDDLRTEVNERTHALDALHLSVNDQMNRVMMEISGVKLQIGQGITMDSITDADGNVLSGVLEGMKTQINAANGNIMVALGEIVDTNSKFDGEILQVKTEVGAEITRITGVIQTTKDGLETRITKAETSIADGAAKISNVTQTVATINADGTTAYKAQWGIKSSVNNLQGGIGFTNDGANTVVTIDASKFRVGQVGVSENAGYPFEIVDNVVRIKQTAIEKAVIQGAQIQNLSVTNAMIKDSLYSDNWVSSGGNQGWFLNRDGTLSLRSSSDGLNRAIFDGEGLKVFRNGVEVFRAGIL